jgi:serine/threonine protein kinase
MVSELEINIRYYGTTGSSSEATSATSHPNLIHLMGLYEDSRDTLFVVFEESVQSLKQTLLDSRALIHYPVYASKHQKVSTLNESQVFHFLIQVADGMDYLSNRKIMHRKLCASNIFMFDDIVKVGGIGLSDYSKTGKELDLLRWTAQEALKSKMYASKCDVWSFGILMWECFSLGGTPYVDVKNRDIANRVMRGMRVPQRDYMSDEVYQLMLQCWQLDLDERPTFHQIKDELIQLQEDITRKNILHLNFVFDVIV